MEHIARLIEKARDQERQSPPQSQPAIPTCAEVRRFIHLSHGDSERGTRQHPRWIRLVKEAVAGSSRGSSPETPNRSGTQKKKFDKRQRAVPPTDYWIGKGSEPSGVGRVAGSRENFSDRRSLAKERLEGLERVCKGSMPTIRHARSHLLLSFQLRETRRLFHQCQERLDVERRLYGIERLDAERETDESFSYGGSALQVGINASRHEIAIAEIHAIHGEKVVEGVEGREPRDRRYQSRTDYVIKEMKKAKVDDAMIHGKQVSSATLPPTAKLSDMGPRSKRGKRGRRAGTRDALSGNGLPNLNKSSRSVGVLKCFTCGTPGHISRECPKKVFKPVI
ncbi:hypothetical protein TCAL_16095 [Tigriopus californicus]|uniref:CCHC-type domain-containing protein n=2 Tax=Tigriopus californicus TaxID=6832 RepID=A0A553PQ03_TIGCA|nr:hypothetical protein TCAL_16095 [Tigriopus californicus]